MYFLSAVCMLGMHAPRLSTLLVYLTYTLINSVVLRPWKFVLADHCSSSVHLKLFRIVNHVRRQKADTECCHVRGRVCGYVLSRRPHSMNRH